MYFVMYSVKNTLNNMEIIHDITILIILGIVLQFIENILKTQ